MPTKKKRDLTPSHKAAMATGRSESRVVKNYLDAIEQNRPKRGRKRTPDSIKKRLATIDQELATASSLARLNLIQERKDLTSELAASGKAGVDTRGLESEFVKVAAAYGQRRRISYATWREAGVPAEVLRKAGISR